MSLAKRKESRYGVGKCHLALVYICGCCSLLPQPLSPSRVCLRLLCLFNHNNILDNLFGTYWSSKHWVIRSGTPACDSKPATVLPNELSVTSYGALRFHSWQIGVLFPTIPPKPDPPHPLEKPDPRIRLFGCAAGDPSARGTPSTLQLKRETAHPLALGAAAPSDPRQGSPRPPVTSLAKRIPGARLLVLRDVGRSVRLCLSAAEEGCSS